jgi:protein-tyrosine phosphatase
LRWPPIVAFRTALRNVVWTVRALRLRNPPIPATVEHVVFLCKGNICRSPFAGLLSARLLTETGSTATVRSAGLKASQAPMPPPDAMLTATTYGLSLEDHRPVDVSIDELRRADVIVVMEVEQAAEVVRRAPDVASRVQLLPLYDPAAARYGAFERVNLVDPFQKGAEAFASCYARIDRCVHAFVAALDARGRPPGQRA